MISHKHKTIFIHIPKTGGQSMEQMFLDDLGLDWAGREPLLLRPNTDPDKGPQRLAHLYADEYVKYGYVTQEQFDSYFKFAVVRDPYARIVSEFFFRFKKTAFWKRPSAPSFVSQSFETDFSDTARHLATQTRYVMDSDGKMIVDQIIKLENLNTEIGPLSEKIFGEARVAPHRNKSRLAGTRRKARIRSQIKAMIRNKYRSDFETFDYPI
jgi:hypothetical protein